MVIIIKTPLIQKQKYVSYYIKNTKTVEEPHTFFVVLDHGIAISERLIYVLPDIRLLFWIICELISLFSILCRYQKYFLTSFLT